MRSRPRVDVELTPGVLVPGLRLRTRTILTSTSETPVDWLKIELYHRMAVAAGAGKGRVVSIVESARQEWRSTSLRLGREKRSFPVDFELPVDAPPTYRGTDAELDWRLRVHVCIPWWPDRVSTFDVPVVLPPSPPIVPVPAAIATSVTGPTGTEPFMEIALDTTRVALGEPLTGTVSLANFRGRRVRGVDVVFAEHESLVLPYAHEALARRFKVRIFEGQPKENEAIPFRVMVPQRAAPTFHFPPVTVFTRLEVVAEVAWGEDVTVVAPLEVLPRGTVQDHTGWIAPVGRERRAQIWEAACARHGFAGDPMTERMVGKRGVLGVEIHTEQRDADFWLVASLAWPMLGIDLAIGERKWTDALRLHGLDTGEPGIDARFSGRSRELPQGRAFATRDLLATLLPFDDVAVHDAGATLAMRGSAHTVERVDGFVTAVLAAADAFAAAHANIPAPAAFADAVPAWQALAERLRGRLELGRMWIHDGSMGQDRVSIGTLWTSTRRKGGGLGTEIRVVVDPVLDPAPVSSDDPALSPSAREAWRSLARMPGVQSVHVARDAIVVDIDGKVDDPNGLLPLIELAVTLRRGVSGIASQGPFR